MKKIYPRLLSLVLICCFSAGTSFSQQQYSYSLDLNKAENSKLDVELITPHLTGSTAVFTLPKIIPGTYSIADYGKFISNVKAFDKSGKELGVKQLSSNKWQINKATALNRLTYTVSDIFHSDIKHNIYPMAATNIENEKCFVINSPGFFGFFDGYRNLPFNISIAKPDSLFGGTSIENATHSAGRDLFKVANVDELYDMPIMYTVPDTTTIKVGNCQVLISVYSPAKNLNSKMIAGWLGDLLEAARQYLGGKLPAERYSFLYYMRDIKQKQSFMLGLGGALEHTTSSFYYFPDIPAEAIKKSLVDASSHEFFHIITPLTIASKEIKEFNYDTAILSKHLWLYEGTTEYTAHHVQVQYGLISGKEFLQRLSTKITKSRGSYNDTVPFTIMSTNSAGKYAQEYANVYEKGALIGACLDLYLLHLSKGAYGLKELKHDLGVRYGKKRYFTDEELFAEIRELSFPEIEDFLKKYVEGAQPIPYDYFFGLAGVQFIPKSERKIFSLGGITPAQGSSTIKVSMMSKLNDFGKAIGYKIGDEIYAINGVPIQASNFLQVADSIKKMMKEGDDFVVKIGRKNNDKIDTMELKGKVSMVTVTETNVLDFMPNPTAQQRLVRQAWLTPGKTVTTAAVAANPADVSSIDAIIKATYEVISGAAGPRNWDRFSSLFLPEAKMGAVVKSATGGSFRSFTPAEYRKNNEPFFMQSAFYEEEVKRNVSETGNVASVTSAYQFRFSSGGKVEEKGTNYFTLVKSDGRWWIENLTWE